MKTIPCRFQNGFTLIELVVIVTVIGVLSVFVSGRFADEDTFEARGYYDELVVAARYAQRYAVASGCEIRFNIEADGGYSVAFANSCRLTAAGSAVQRPDGAAFSRAVPPAGVTVSSGAFSAVYDAYGDASGGGNITVSGGGANLPFTVTPGSGFVNMP